MRHLTIERYSTSGDARCASCKELPRNATREQVRRHVDRTGHLVRFEVMDVTQYRRAERPS